MHAFLFPKSIGTSGEKQADVSRRLFGLDLIRALAILLVIFAHFYVRTGYITVPVYGERFFFATVFREITAACVPLFFLLSGYLMKNKIPVKAYYFKIIRLLVLFVIVGFVCDIYRVFVNGEDFSFTDWIYSFTSFSANGYCWYLRAYIGLFILIPFLNMIIRAMSQKQFRILLVSMLLVFSLPVFLQSIGFLMSNYWKDFYPVTYYLLGAYLSIYKPNVRKSVLIACVLGFAFLQAGLLYAVSYGQKLPTVNVEYGHLITVFIAVCLFLLFYQANAPRSRLLCRFISSVSRVSYSMFLVSWLYDQAFYNLFFNRLIPSFYNRIFFMPFTVLVVFFLSYATALILEGVYDRIGKKCTGCFRKNQTREQTNV